MKNRLFQNSSKKEDAWDIVGVLIPGAQGQEYYAFPRRNEFYTDRMKNWFTCGRGMSPRSASIKKLLSPARIRIEGNKIRILKQGEIELWQE